MLEFRAFAYGSADESPFDLDATTLDSNIAVRWARRKESNRSQHGFAVESRVFTALLEASGEPGERRAEINFQNDGDVVYKHVLSWEVATPIEVSPKIIVMKRGEGKYHVVLRTRDQRPFRVKQIGCTESGITCDIPDADSAPEHRIEIFGQGMSAREGARGMIRVFTDNLEQEQVDVPFLLID